MAQYRGTIVLEGGSNGWTEQYYLVGSSQAAAVDNLLFIAAGRIAILQADCAIQTAFLSDVAVRGDSVLIPGISGPGTAVDPLGFVDLDIALLVKWQVGVFTRNKTFLRGLPAAQLVSNQWAFTTPFLVLLGSYISAVIANAVMPITTRNLSPPPNYIISSYAPILAGNANIRAARRKSGRPFGLPRGRRVAP